MIRRIASTLSVALFAALFSCAVCAAPFRSIGARFIIPLGGLPVVLGLEATAELGSLIGSLSFFLSLSIFLVTSLPKFLSCILNS